MPRDDSWFRTIPACNRCRKRKSRCDTGRPSCARCRSAGCPCEYVDPRTKETVSRQYIKDLEDQLLQLELTAREKGLSALTPVESFNGNVLSPTAPVFLPGQSPFANSRPDSRSGPSPTDNSRGDSHLHGVSSGIHLARSVLEAARLQNGNLENTATEGSSMLGQRASTDQNTQAAVPMPIAAAILPSRSTAQGLVQVFFSNCQVQYPILSEQAFSREVLGFYDFPENVSSDSRIKIRFRLNMVLAIGLLYLSRDNADALALAENYHESAMQDLIAVMGFKDLVTIQCLLLIFLYSLLNSTRAPMWYLSGLSMRMCVDLGLHNESLIQAPVNANPPTGDEINEKRRLFWVTYTLDRTLSIILGRPLSMRDGAIDVKYPEGAEDDLGHKQMIHWIKLQQMQSEMVSYLYIAKKNGENIYDAAALNSWLKDMMSKLADWRNEAMQYIDFDSHTADWWTYWYNNGLLLLLRPSLNNPSADPSALQSCYTAAISTIQISFIRQNEHVMDFTWTSVHHQFMAGITLLFAIWNSSEVRAKAISEWTTVKSCLIQCGVVLEGLGKRWQSAKGAREVLQKLSATTIEALEKEMRGPQLWLPNRHPHTLDSTNVDQPTMNRNNTADNDTNRDMAVPSHTQEPSSTIWAETTSLEPTSFQAMFGEDLARNLYADPAAFYGFDNLGPFDDLDWSQTASALNFQGDQDDHEY